MIKYNILKQTELSAVDMMQDSNALIDLGGRSNGNHFGLGAFQVQFVVEMTNDVGKTQCFTVVYEPVERNNRIEVYSGYEMATAVDYGCNVDQSRELLEFCDYDTVMLDALHGIATYCAKVELERLLSETRFWMNPHTGSVDTMESWADEGYTPENSELIEVFYDGGAWVDGGVYTERNKSEPLNPSGR